MKENSEGNAESERGEEHASCSELVCFVQFSSLHFFCHPLTHNSCSLLFLISILTRFLSTSCIYTFVWRKKAATTLSRNSHQFGSYALLYVSVLL